MENIEKSMFEKVSDIMITKVIFAYNTENEAKHIRQVLILEAWDRAGRWNGNFNFHITTGSYSTIYSDLGLDYFGEIYNMLKEDGVDDIVIGTLEDIVRSYLPSEALEEESGEVGQISEEKNEQ